MLASLPGSGRGWAPGPPEEPPRVSFHSPDVCLQIYFLRETLVTPTSPCRNQAALVCDAKAFRTEADGWEGGVPRWTLTELRGLL